MLWREVKVKQGAAGWAKPAHGHPLPPELPERTPIRIYQIQPAQDRFYVVDAERRGHFIHPTNFEAEREYQLPFTTRRAWTHESDPRVHDALREEMGWDRRRDVPEAAIEHKQWLIDRIALRGY